MINPHLNTWVYVRSEPNLYTVGFYAPDGTWHADSDFNSPEEARQRVAWLNGGKNESNGSLD